MSPEAGAILARVRENHRRLDGCRRHLFTATAVRIGEKLKCEHCGGEISLTNIGAYIAGYRAAGGDAADIWPAYAQNKDIDV
jgi:hypothetical protein